MAIKLGRFELPNRVTKDEKTATDTYAYFVAEPFEAGFGHTIGNSLRRVLLSSLEGAAITSVQIDGVQHEFSAIKGVVEDAAEIVLNLKKVLCVSHSRKTRQLTIDVKRQGAVTAADIVTDGTVEILNPKQHICTLSEERRLKMQLDISVGRGYQPSELLKGEDDPIGKIAMDALFSPVRKVKYTIENTRVGQQMNYDRLIVEVWTDGRLTPDEALKQASAVLRKHLDVFVEYDEHYVEFESPKREREDEEEELRKLLAMPISEIELSVRAANCIANAQIKTIGDLVQKTEADMLKYRNFGKKSLGEIRAILENMGLSLGMQVDHLLAKGEADQEDIEE
ncbi:MAG: DNA-directed RNA polymerase subunit alpha [Verrucomicrobia bacterium]|nr:DNA-directed RNA polymerase subunit alpha [Verrucomicrobiota bacterium]